MSPESPEPPELELFEFPEAPQPRKRGRVTAFVLFGALAVVVVLAWLSPQAREILPGPSATEVALETEKARSADLKRQLDEANAKLAEPKPPVVDESAVARAEDLKRQLDALGMNDARSDDLAAQLTAATAKLKKGKPTQLDPAQRARADDLAAQNQVLSEQLSRPRPPEVPVIVPDYTKAEILAQRNLFGLYTQQSPFSYAEVDKIQGDVGRKANIVGYFQSWTDPFRADALQDAWAHGQIPLMTWEPQDQVGNITNTNSAFSLPRIIAGEYDDYIRTYADGIKALGMPVIIRLAHEMNGTWYPWSEWDYANNRSINGNSIGDYAKFWRHVHDIFEQQGANDYAIWLWAPNRVNKIPSQAAPPAFYPGDDVVDLIGMSGYFRPGDPNATFANAYGLTLPLLRQATTAKPIFLAEIGATEDGGKKPFFINDLFRGLAANPDIIGFAWFSLTVTSTNENGRNTNDWRIDSSGSSISTMATNLATAGYGLAP